MYEDGLMSYGFAVASNYRRSASEPAAIQQGTKPLTTAVGMGEGGSNLPAHSVRKQLRAEFTDPPRSARRICRVPGRESYTGQVCDIAI